MWETLRLYQPLRLNHQNHQPSSEAEIWHPAAMAMTQRRILCRRGKHTTAIRLAYAAGLHLAASSFGIACIASTFQSRSQKHPAKHEACRECFYPTVSLKFRKSLAQMLNPNEKTKKAKGNFTEEHSSAGDLLLGFSGGIGSTILLDMVWRRYILDADEKGSNSTNVGAETLRRRPSVWKTIRVAYVEQCAARPNVSLSSHRTRKHA